MSGKTNAVFKAVNQTQWGIKYIMTECMQIPKDRQIQRHDSTLTLFDGPRNSSTEKLNNVKID